MNTKLILFFFAFCAITNGVKADDAEVRRLIKGSLAAYPGPCPCPYSTMRNGKRCEHRSAYTKPGGYEPLCYAEDVYRLFPELKKD